MGIIGQSIKVKNFKCFGEKAQGLENIKPINLLIGRNNSGKSSLLDLIEYLCDPADMSKFGHNSNSPKFIIEKSLDESELRSVFSESVSGGVIGGNHWNFGRDFIDKSIEFYVKKNGSKEIINIEDFPEDRKYNKLKEKLSRNLNIDFNNKTFLRLSAERDIKPESDTANKLRSNGDGATNIIQKFLNKADYESNLVENQLLDYLNIIMEPDASFDRVLVQQYENNKWEVFLEEKEKGKISLSDSGSGLKTIILILSFILLIPEFENKVLDSYIFAFEELENNLHPALQRRLFKFLSDFVIENNINAFITTHSNVPIDMFNVNKDAQIYHVLHDGKTSNVDIVKTYVDRAGVLDDLDIRASDILQANGIIWVEGPTDRMYINKWIELWSNDKLKEGVHYQCVFYGGRLLSHLTADVDNGEIKESDLINILTTNRNSVVLIDSDKKYRADPINSTKKRIKKELKKIDGFCWITKGKEIENYLPVSAIEDLYKLEIDDQVEFGKYEIISEFLESVSSGEGNRFLRSKVKFSEKIIPYLTKQNCESIWDLDEQMSKLIDKIRSWNCL